MAEGAAPRTVVHVRRVQETGVAARRACSLCSPVRVRARRFPVFVLAALPQAPCLCPLQTRKLWPDGCLEAIHRLVRQLASSALLGVDLHPRQVPVPVWHTRLLPIVPHNRGHHFVDVRLNQCSKVDIALDDLAHHSRVREGGLVVVGHGERRHHAFNGAERRRRGGSMGSDGTRRRVATAPRKRTVTPNNQEFPICRLTEHSCQINEICCMLLFFKHRAAYTLL